MRGNPMSRSVAVRDDLTQLFAGDLHLFNEGSHFRLYEKMGAHLASADGQAGAFFAVWAPDAERVSVMGSFNDWNNQSHPLHSKGQSGIWEGFVPGIEAGTLYKYHIASHYGGYRVDKADPFGFRHEEPPRTASVVWDLGYEWGD